MNTRTRLKWRKFVRRPGEFFRDAFLNRYPLSAGQSLPYADSQETFSLLPVDIAANHHLRDPFEPTMPVDAVLTWVDGMDPDWQRRKLRVAPTDGGDRTSHDPARFHSHDELRFCLRSLHSHAPWIRRIYLVTDQQQPTWLRSHGKIVIVDHSDIIPDKYLPTFNSHVIETWLHRIPGLSEHFIYLNDDVMFGRATPKGHYFASNGLARNFLSDQQLPSRVRVPTMDMPTDDAARNARRLIRSAYNVEPRYHFEHTVFALRRSSFEAVHDQFAKQIAHSCHNRVRAKGDIPVASCLVPNVAFLRGDATSERTDCVHFDIHSPIVDEFYAGLLARRERCEAPYSICINQASTGCDTAEVGQRMLSFLQDYFPESAPWEGESERVEAKS